MTIVITANTSLIQITDRATNIHQIKQITDITTTEILTGNHITIENTAIDNLITTTETKGIKRFNTQNHTNPKLKFMKWTLAVIAPLGVQICLILMNKLKIKSLQPKTHQKTRISLSHTKCIA